MFQQTSNQKLTEEVNIYQDTLTFCVESICQKAQEYSVAIDENFKNDLSWKLFSQALVYSLQEYKEFDQTNIENILQSEESDEMLLKVAMYIETYPGFAQTFTTNILVVYLGYCIKYNIESDTKAHELLNLMLS